MQTLVDKAINILVLIFGLFLIHEAWPVLTAWAKDELYGLPDWLLLVMLALVLFAAYAWFVSRLFRGTEIDAKTKQTIRTLLGD